LRYPADLSNGHAGKQAINENSDHHCPNKQPDVSVTFRHRNQLVDRNKYHRPGGKGEKVSVQQKRNADRGKAAGVFLERDRQFNSDVVTEESRESRVTAP
jgi:hypothetical protein